MEYLITVNGYGKVHRTRDRNRGLVAAIITFRSGMSGRIGIEILMTMGRSLGEWIYRVPWSDGDASVRDFEDSP